jgi:hypothetical protein
MGETEDSYQNTMQRAADIKNLIESRGWKILQEELDILKTIELENLLRSSKYTDILSSQALIKAYGLINEIVDNLLQAGETADYEFKLIKKKK